MYMVSCRKGFDSNEFFADGNQYRNYTNPADPSKFQKSDIVALVSAAKNKHVLVLVHGFNTPMDGVLDSYWRLVTGLDEKGMTGVGQYGLIVGFAWPGLRFGISYLGSVPMAMRSGGYLRDLITVLRGAALTVDVQTHSLGARVALKALLDPKKTFVDNLLLTAAAIDNHLLEPGKLFAPALNSVNRCFTYDSANDPVLGGTYWIGDILDGIHPALGWKGPRSKPITLKTPNLYVVDCSARVKSHGGYRKSNQYYAHWKDVLAGGPMESYDELS